MIVFPNCKINLGLHITSKRTDGFHNIETVFYPINLRDALEIQISENEFLYSSSGIPIQGTAESNLCVKAYKLLKADFSTIGNIQMHLHKTIPSGAGLGGGSSNAAFTIKLLSDLFELQLTSEQMQEYARKLGSDCAFFIENKPVYATEKGDQFQPIEIDLSNYKMGIVKPSLFIGTPEAYAGVTPQQPKLSIKDILKKPISDWKGLLINDFEKSIFIRYPELSQIKQQLYELGALYASMSGSGSAFYGIFEKGKTINLKHTFPNYFAWQQE